MISDHRSLSPVIGVVLMVAITAILATVVATMVMGFTGFVEPEVDAGVTIDENSSDYVTVTYTARGTSDHVLIRGDCSFSNDRLDNVGSSSTEGCSTDDEIIVVAVQDDGTESVADTYAVK